MGIGVGVLRGIGVAVGAGGGFVDVGLGEIAEVDVSCGVGVFGSTVTAALVVGLEVGVDFVFV